MNDEQGFGASRRASFTPADGAAQRGRGADSAPRGQREGGGMDPSAYVEPDIYAGIDLDADAAAPPAPATPAPARAAGPAPTGAAAPAPARAAAPAAFAAGATSAASARVAPALDDAARERRARIMATAAALEAEKKRAVRRRIIAAGALLALAVVLASILIPRLLGGGEQGGFSAATASPRVSSTAGHGQEPLASASTDAAPGASEEAGATPGSSGLPAATGATGYDTTSASSLQVLVNKLTPLNPPGYTPDDLVSMSSIGIPSQNGHSLRSAAATGIQSLFAAAEAEGISLDMTSGFRDADLQRTLYDGYVASLGQEGADATSARPSYSEHQTGLTADISAPSEGCPLEACFADTRAGRWLAEHAWEHGFILRYPEGQTATTGYEFEPWHYRFIGVEAAAAYRASGAATYEAFLGAPAAPDYAS